MKYRAEIDGLRALAVLPVILFHAGFEWFSGGFVGVDVFFVISGYLITTIIISEMAEGKFSIANFYERRARRILPALFFVMAVSIPFAWLWLTPTDLANFGQSLVAVSTFSSNILFWLESGYFDTSAELKPLLHTWSLAVEEQYYILFPIFLMLTWRLGIKRILILLSIIFLISLGVAQYGAYHFPTATFFLLPTRGWELLVGVFAAFYLKYNTHLKSHSINQTLSLVGFAMIIYSIVEFDQTTPFPSLYTLIPTIGTGLLILCAVPKTFAHRFLSLKYIVGIGLISYSTYLWHQPLLAFMHHKLTNNISDMLIVFLCFLAFFIGWISWHYIEKPFRERKKISRSLIFKLSFVLIVLFFCFGQWMNLSNGRLDSYSINDQNIYRNFFQPEEYVVKQHTQIRLHNFNKKNQMKDIFIIGDSFSQDIVNSVFEAGLDTDFEFSSYYIRNECGILVDVQLLEETYNSKRIKCTSWKNFEKRFFDVLKAADEVWLVSSWKLSDVKQMKASIKNVQLFNKNIKVFGSKDFGSFNASFYKNKDRKLWSSIGHTEYEKKKYEELSLLNQLIQLESESAGVTYIEIQKTICEGLDYCSNFVENQIISYDGDHLTQFGATLLGSKLNSILR